MTTSITGQGITAYKVPDDALSNESKNAVQNKVVNSSVYFINKELDAYKRFLNDGAYTITADDLESGQWSYSRKDVNAARARTKALIPVRAGTIITYENTTFDIYFGVLQSIDSMGYIEVPNWKTDGSGTINITKNGYLTFVIRNHADNTAAVNPANFDSVVTIRTSTQSNLLNAISQNEESIADTQSMIATVEATTTASKNYAVGDLLVYDGKLYKVTSAIATGATIIVGSNVTQTTVEDQIGSGGGSGGAVDDVQINGTSIVNNGIASIPFAGQGGNVGVVSTNPYYGTMMVNGNTITLYSGDVNAYKAGSSQWMPVVINKLDLATFYGLAKAAGDTTMPNSSNAVGTYTEEAKSAIQTMLGVAGIVGTVEGTTASKAYAIGDAFLHSGTLYKATTSIASGDAITPGTNCTQTTLISIIKGE